ncbi:hypothetical protein AAG570_002861 [Ranatra chinensis]|uniref:Nucleoporin Nup37 n=1 Tax=Ranatra chinensis TaxID=642074 RepID=A0ABD0Y549_9HEMI
MDKLHSTVRPDGPNYVLEMGSQVLDIEFSPYEWSHEVLAVAFVDKIMVASIKFKEEFEDNIEDDLIFECVQEFPLYTRVHSMSWSSETSLRDIPKCVVLAAATGDFSIQVLTGHTNYVNSISYQPAGEYLASASDDLTCRVWTVENDYQPYCKFYLQTPGMEVRWHSSERGKLLVGEKCGTICLYNIGRETAIMSIRTPASSGPLMSFDWAPTNQHSVVALCGQFIVLWHLMAPSSPNMVRSVNSQIGRKVRFSQLSDQKMALLGEPDHTLKLFVMNKQQVTTLANLKLSNGLTWHHHLPYVCVGVDKTISIWKIT